MAERGVELTCTHRKKRVRESKQDGRKLRQYACRWKIERTVAWLHASRRLVLSHEFYSSL